MKQFLSTLANIQLSTLALCAAALLLMMSIYVTIRNRKRSIVARKETFRRSHNKAKEALVRMNEGATQTKETMALIRERYSLAPAQATSAVLAPLPTDPDLTISKPSACDMADIRAATTHEVDEEEQVTTIYDRNEIANFVNGAIDRITSSEENDVFFIDEGDAKASEAAYALTN